MPEDQEVLRRKSDELKLFGFESGEPVYYIEEVEFTLEDVKQSLFSTYSEPYTLPLSLGRNTGLLQVVVTSVTSSYVGLTNQTTDSTLGCWEHPDWKLEGWLVKSGFDPYKEVVRVRIYLTSEPDGTGIDALRIQRIPSSPDPEELVREQYVDE